MSTPEWDIFARIEKLENIVPETKDNLILAVSAYAMSFLSLTLRTPSRARKFEDDMAKQLGQVGLSDRLLEVITDLMTNICNDVEKKQ